MISGWINALWTFQGIELTDELRMVFSAFVQLNPLLKFLDNTVAEGFVSAKTRANFIVDDDASELIEKLCVAYLNMQQNEL